MKEKGLTGFQLKLIALVLMVFDHIYYFFSFKNIPIIFTWVGRVVAPIFIFTAVEGYYHTRSKKKYILRLYIGFVFMNVGNNIVSRFLPRPDNVLVTNNIFSTLLLIIIYISILDFMEKAIEEKDIFKTILGIIFFIIPVIIDLIISLNPGGLMSLSNIIPMVSITEGGPMFVLIGTTMYMFRDDRNRQLIIYSLLSLLFGGYQWMMIFATPLLYLYNGEKGRGMKYLFYIFYPAHIYILYIISVYILLL